MEGEIEERGGRVTRRASQGWEKGGGPPWTVFKKRSPRLKIFLNFLGAFKDFHGFELVSRSSKTVFWSLETSSKPFLELDMVGF